MALWFTSLRHALTWNPYFSERTTTNRVPRRLRLPDLFLPLQEHSERDFRVNSLCKATSEASDAWISAILPLAGDSNSRTSRKLSTIISEENIDMKAGLLAALCFPAVDAVQLRLCADVLNWLFHLEYRLAALSNHAATVLLQNLSQVINGRSDNIEGGFAEALQSILTRVARSPASIFNTFTSALHAHISFIVQRTSDAIAQITPDIESYVALQRSEGFSRVLFALVIFAHGLQLPDEQKYWSLSALTEAAGDSIFYAMDIFTRVSRGKHFSPPAIQTHNIASLLTPEQQQVDPESHPLQAALDHAAVLHQQRLRDFLSLKYTVLSSLRNSALQRCSGVKRSVDGSVSSDADVAIYVRSLSDCVSAVLYWSFESERYFGRDGMNVKLHRSLDTASIQL